MNKFIGLIILTTILSGCDSSNERAVSYQNDIQFRDGLKDCQIFVVHDNVYENLVVVRCPKSSTSTNYSVPSGKSRRSVQTVVVDGVSYEPTTKESNP